MGGEEDTDMTGASRSRNISVAIRLRPLSKEERRACNAMSYVAGDPHPSCIRDLQSSQVKEYDYVFDSKTSTEQLFEACVGDIVCSHCEGYNGAIFAYGQTSSGKTFTMYGDEGRPGVINLAVDKIFKYIATHPDRNFVMELAYLEIYNEQVFDLRARSSNNPRTEVQVFEDENGESVFKGLTWLKVTGPEDIQTCLEKGAQQRHVGATEMNERSSRSHTILRIKLESMQKDCSKTVLSSVLDLVDLAGSEGLRHTDAVGERRREGRNINTSLLALSQVIKWLSDKSRSSSAHVSFRESKLTRILRSSLGGNSQTVIICAVSPAATNYSATQSTLEFASRARSVCNKVHVNRITKVDDASERIRSLCVKVHNLEEEIRKTKEKQRQYLESIRARRGENDYLQREVEDLENQIKKTKSRILNAKSLRELGFAFSDGKDQQGSRGTHADSSALPANTLDRPHLGNGRRSMSSNDVDLRRRSRTAGRNQEEEEEEEKQKAEAEQARLLKKQALEGRMKMLRDKMEQVKEEHEQLDLQILGGGGRGAIASGSSREESAPARVKAEPRSTRVKAEPRSASLRESSHDEDGLGEAALEEAAGEDEDLTSTDASRHDARRRWCSRSPRRNVKSEQLSPPSSPIPAARHPPLPAPPEPVREPSEQERQLVQRIFDVVKPDINVRDWSPSNLQIVLSSVHQAVHQFTARRSSQAGSSVAAPVRRRSVSLRDSSPAADADMKEASVLEQRRGRSPATPLQNRRRMRRSAEHDNVEEAPEDPAPAAATNDLEPLHAEFRELTKVDKEYTEERKRHRAASLRSRSADRLPGAPAGRPPRNSGVQREAAAASAAAAAGEAASRRAEVAEFTNTVSMREKEVSLREQEVSNTRTQVRAERDRRSRSRDPLHPGSAEVFAARDAARAQAETLNQRRRAFQEGFGEDERHLLQRQRVAPERRNLRPRPSQAPHEAPPASWGPSAAMPLQDGCVGEDSFSRPQEEEEPFAVRRLSRSFAQAFSPPRAAASRQEARAPMRQTLQEMTSTTEHSTLTGQLEKQKERLGFLKKTNHDLQSTHNAVRAEVEQRQEQHEDLQSRLREQPAAHGRAADGAGRRGVESGTGAAHVDNSDPAAVFLSRLEKEKSRRVVGESQLASMQQDIACAQPELRSVTQATREQQIRKVRDAEAEKQKIAAQLGKFESDLDELRHSSHQVSPASSSGKGRMPAPANTAAAPAGMAVAPAAMASAPGGHQATGGRQQLAAVPAAARPRAREPQTHAAGGQGSEGCAQQ
mmetsp:Transcript_152822/g.284727  ORF Transcript_152822/g.284727 Transcript_152822/m.284727 type:complete len:1275 (+) Transcript_152822:107-3931(+)